MASFDFDFPAISAGTTFVFGSWVCITNGAGGFSRHLINTTSTEALSLEQLDEIGSGEFFLPQLADEIKTMSLSDTTPTRSRPTHFPLGLKNSVVSYSVITCRKLNQGITARDVVAYHMAPLFDSYPDSDGDTDTDSLSYQSLTIMATPQSRVVYWKNSEPINLLDNARLLACLRDLPYQSGRPLSPIVEKGVGNIALVDYSTTHSTPERQVYVSIHGDDSALRSQADQYVNENLD